MRSGEEREVVGVVLSCDTGPSYGFRKEGRVGELRVFATCSLIREGGCAKYSHGIYTNAYFNFFFFFFFPFLD